MARLVCLLQKVSPPSSGAEPARAPPNRGPALRRFAVKEPAVEVDEIALYW